MENTPWSDETERADWYKDQYSKAVESLNKSIIPDDNFGALCTCAIRYCIGRESYMPSLIINYLTPLLPLLDNRTLAVMKKDIEHADYWGDEVIDKPLWRKFWAYIEAELEERKCP